MNNIHKLLTLFSVLLLEGILVYLSMISLFFPESLGSLALVLLGTGVLFALATVVLFKKKEPRPLMIMSVLLISIMLLIILTVQVNLIFIVLAIAPIIYILGVCLKVQTTGMF